MQCEACHGRPGQNAADEIVPAVRRGKRQRLPELAPGVVCSPGVGLEKSERKVSLPFGVQCRRWGAAQDGERLVEKGPGLGQGTRRNPGLGQADRRVGAYQRFLSLGPDGTSLL